MRLIFNDFYCLNCGQKILTLPRVKSMQRKRFHRKKLYCPHCGKTLNAVECRDDIDVYEFKEAFNNGDFQEEAMISIKECAEV